MAAGRAHPLAATQAGLKSRHAVWPAGQGNRDFIPACMLQAPPEAGGGESRCVTGTFESRVSAWPVWRSVLGAAQRPAAPAAPGKGNEEIGNGVSRISLLQFESNAEALGLQR